MQVLKLLNCRTNFFLEISQKKLSFISMKRKYTHIFQMPVLKLLYTECFITNKKSIFTLFSCEHFNLNNAFDTDSLKREFVPWYLY